MLKLFHIWLARVHSKCVLYPFNMFSSDFESFSPAGTTGAHLVFSLPTALESAKVPRGDGSFSRVWYLETKIWELGVLITTEVLLLLSSFSGQSKEIYKIYIIR